MARESEETLEGVAEGDRALWDAMVRQEASVLGALEPVAREVCLREFRHRGVPENEVDDLIHETCLSAWRFAPEHTDFPESFRGFLKWRGIGVLTAYRRKRKRDEAQPLPVDPVRDDFRPLESLVLDELAAALRSCRDELSENLRIVWAARHERELSGRDTAVELGLTDGAVALRLHRAKDHLWKCLQRKGVLDEV